VDLREFGPRFLGKTYTLLKVSLEINHFFTVLQVARLLAGQAGFEPATPGFGVRCSVQLELLTLLLPSQMRCVYIILYLSSTALAGGPSPFREGAKVRASPP